MARDRGLEELLNESLEAAAGLTEKAMFGGWAWLVNGQPSVWSASRRHVSEDR